MRGAHRAGRCGGDGRLSLGAGMNTASGARVLEVDEALTEGFLRYASEHGVAHDNSYLAPEDLARFDPAAEPATVVVDGSGTVIGAASVMLDGYLSEGISRLRILHALDPAYYPALIDHALARIPEQAERVLLFLPEHAGDVEDAVAAAGFAMCRRAYVLRHFDPKYAPEPQFPSEVHLEQATPAVAIDWAHVANAAFRGSPGRYDMTPDHVRELLARDRIIPEGSFIAHREGVPAGLVLTLSDARDPCTAEIETLAVAPAMQGKGLGRALLLTALRAVGRAGCRSVSLSVSTYNRRAVALYLGAGFRAEDVRVCWERTRA